MNNQSDNIFDRLFPNHIFQSKQKRQERERRELAKYTTERSQAANVLLTLFLGPIGLLYASPSNAFSLIILLVLGAPVLGVIMPDILSSPESFMIFLAGYLMLAIPISWLLSLISGCVAVSKHNQKVSANRERREQDRHIEQLEAIEKSSKQAREEAKEQETEQRDNTESRSENPYY